MVFFFAYTLAVIMSFPRFAALPIPNPHMPQTAVKHDRHTVRTINIAISIYQAIMLQKEKRYKVLWQ
jgi:hypothetical protein